MCVYTCTCTCMCTCIGVCVYVYVYGQFHVGDITFRDKKIKYKCL